MDPVATLKSAVFHEDYDQMVVVKDIEFYSLCEHHILPFFGKVHVAYIPNGNIVGLSKIPRMVDIFSHRLQVQEHLTKQICDCLQQALNPLGAIVVVEAQHMCIQMRGIERLTGSSIALSSRLRFFCRTFSEGETSPWTSEESIIHIITCIG